MKNSKYLLIALSILSLSACSNVSKYSTDDVYNTIKKMDLKKLQKQKMVIVTFGQKLKMLIN